MKANDEMVVALNIKEKQKSTLHTESGLKEQPITEVALEHAKAVGRGTARAAEGLVDTIVDIILHPIDTIYTGVELVYDAHVINAASTRAVPTIFNPILQCFIVNNPNLYFEPEKRMQQRKDGIVNAYNGILMATGPQKTEILSTLVGSAVLPYGATKLAIAAKNYKAFGSFSHPPIYFEPGPPEILNPRPVVRPVSLLEIRSQKNAEYLYVIDRNGKLVIADRDLRMSIIVDGAESYGATHTDILGNEPVTGAGYVYVKNGKISGIQSSSIYEVDELHNKKPTEHVFIRHGYKEAKGKFIVSEYNQAEIPDMKNFLEVNDYLFRDPVPKIRRVTIDEIRNQKAPKSYLYSANLNGDLVLTDLQYSRTSNLEQISTNRLKYPDLHIILDVGAIFVKDGKIKAAHNFMVPEKGQIFFQKEIQKIFQEHGYDEANFFPFRDPLPTKEDMLRINLWRKYHDMPLIERDLHGQIRREVGDGISPYFLGAMGSINPFVSPFDPIQDKNNRQRLFLSLINDAAASTNNENDKFISQHVAEGNDFVLNRMNRPSPDIQADKTKSHRESVVRLKKLMDKASKASGNALIENVRNIEKQMKELDDPEILQQHLTKRDWQQLSEIIDRTEHLAYKQSENRIEKIVDSVNAVFDGNYFIYKYKDQQQNQRSSDIEAFDPIPVLGTLKNIVSPFNEKGAYRIGATALSLAQAFQGGDEILSVFDEKGISALFDAGVTIGSGNFASGLVNLLKLWGEQKNPNAPMIKMMQGLSSQVARMHQDMLEGFRQMSLAMGMMKLDMAYRFDKSDLLAKQRHAEIMITLQNIEKFLYFDRVYLQSISEALKRIELGLGAGEIDREDWSNELFKIKTNLDLYKREGINRKLFYDNLSSLVDLLHQTKSKAVNRAKKVDVNSYYELSKGLSASSDSLGSENSGNFKEINFSNRFKLITEQHINLILNYIHTRFRDHAEISKKLEITQNPEQPLYPIEQFNPIALSEITKGVMELIAIYKKGVFCPKSLTSNQLTHDQSNCRLNKIEVLERLKQIQNYYNSYLKCLELLSDKKLNEEIIHNHILALDKLTGHTSKALEIKMKSVYFEDMRNYFTRLDQLSLDLQLQKHQGSNLEIGVFVTCPHPEIGTVTTFSAFEWVGLWDYGWRGRGWGVVCSNWAPCGSYYPPGALINISKDRYINERRRDYQLEIEKILENVEKLKKDIDSPEKYNNCSKIYSIDKVVSIEDDGEIAHCFPNVNYAFPSNPKLFNDKKIIFPLNNWMLSKIPKQIRRSIIPGYSKIDFLYDIDTQDGKYTLQISGLWQNIKTKATYSVFDWTSEIKVFPPLTLEEAFTYHLFGGDKPTGTCETYDEGLKRISNKSDGVAKDHYFNKIWNGGQDWPVGNWVWTGGSEEPGTQWMRLLFMRPSSSKVLGILNSDDAVLDQKYPANENSTKIAEDIISEIVKEREAFLSEKRRIFFQEYLMNLLVPDIALDSSLSKDERLSRNSLFEVDATAKISRAILASSFNATEMNFDLGLMNIFDKNSIIFQLNRYNGTRLTLFNQIKLNRNALNNLRNKITQNSTEAMISKIVHPLIMSTKAELDKLIEMEEDNAITPLEEAIYPETEKEIIDNINPLAKTMASLQAASQIVQNNPQKLSYLGPMLQHSHKMIGDALRNQGYLLDNSENVDSTKLLAETSDTPVALENTQTPSIPNEKIANSDKPKSSFGIQGVGAEPIGLDIERSNTYSIPMQQNAETAAQTSTASRTAQPFSLLPFGINLTKKAWSFGVDFMADACNKISRSVGWTKVLSNPTPLMHQTAGSEPQELHYAGVIQPMRDIPPVISTSASIGSINPNIQNLSLASTLPKASENTSTTGLMAGAAAAVGVGFCLYRMYCRKSKPSNVTVPENSVKQQVLLTIHDRGYFYYEISKLHKVLKRIWSNFDKLKDDGESFMMAYNFNANNLKRLVSKFERGHAMLNDLKRVKKDLNHLDKEVYGDLEDPTLIKGFRNRKVCIK